MSDTVIRVENLSKKYVLSHQQESGSYKALRDVIADGAKLIGKSFLKPSSKAIKPSREEFWALKDVSFEIKQGDRVGIIGGNGAGKSTLLKILSRIIEPTRGTIRIQGRVASLLEVGTGFHPELTGRENVYLNGAILGMSRIEIKRKFDEIVAFAEVEKFLDTPVKRYSSGMYVRLAFAVAAHLEPEILIVDEVLAVGDTQFQKKCLTKMETIADEGRTVLFVSHNVGAMRSLCNQGIWLKSGQVALSGSIRSITDQYLGSAFNTANQVVDLRTAHRAHTSGSDLRVIAMEFNRGSSINHGEPLIVHIEYKTYKPIHGVAFGIGFSTVEGTRLMTLDSDISGVLWDLPNTPSVIEMSLDTLHLQPGRYLVDIGARLGTGIALDYLPGCLQIEVLPGSSTPDAIVQGEGGVRMPAQWRCLGSDRLRSVSQLN